jgi:16S rRNA processing protein RimM
MSRAHQVTERHDEPSGSPHKGEPVYVVIGKLRRPHGISGEILLEILSENPENFEVGKQIFIGSRKMLCKINSLRQTNKLWLISLEGYESREQVALLTNQQVFMRKDELKNLPEGRFYHHEVIGMRVLDEKNALLGEVSEILVTGANDVYVVKTPAGEDLLIPAIKSVVQNIDRETRCMVVRLQEWA